MPSRLLTFVIYSLLFSSAQATASEATESGMGGSVLQLILGFLLILGLLFATLWVLKKISLPRGGASNLLRVVSAAAVGPRERVVLVDVGDKRLVLGVAPGHVSLLDTQPVPPHAAAPANDLVAGKPMFSQRLKQILAQRNENN